MLVLPHQRTSERTLCWQCAIWRVMRQGLHLAVILPMVLQIRETMGLQ